MAMFRSCSAKRYYTLSPWWWQDCSWKGQTQFAPEAEPPPAQQLLLRRPKACRFVVGNSSWLFVLGDLGTNKSHSIRCRNWNTVAFGGSYVIGHTFKWQVMTQNKGIRFPSVVAHGSTYIQCLSVRIHSFMSASSAVCLSVCLSVLTRECVMHKYLLWSWIFFVG